MYPCESFAKKGPQPLTFCAVCGVLASGKQCASRVPPPGCDPEGKDTKITQGNGKRNGRETGRQGTRQQTSGERTLEPQHAEKSARRHRHRWPDCWPAQNHPAATTMAPESVPPLKAIVHTGTFGDSWRSYSAPTLRCSKSSTQRRRRWTRRTRWKRQVPSRSGRACNAATALGPPRAPCPRPRRTATAAAW